MKYLLMIIIFCLSISCICYGDKLILINGDQITGKFDCLENGKLDFTSQFAGVVTVDVKNIRTFNTDEPVEIHFIDGTIIHQKILTAVAGQISIGGGGILKAQEFNIFDIASINPSKVSPDESVSPPVGQEPAAEKEQPKPVKWEGSISAGLSTTRGNTRTDNQNLSVDLSKRGQKDRITLNADYARGEQEDPDTGEDDVTEHWWRTRAKYDYFLTKKFYIYGQNRYEKDSIAKLDRRVIVGGGSGYQWIENDEMNFSTEAGLASLYEKFETKTESNSEVSAELGYHFDKKLWQKIKFINDLSYYPSTDDVSDYFLTTTAEIRASITEKMFSNFKVIFDYDSTPAEDTDKTDVKYMLGVGWNF